MSPRRALGEPYESPIGDGRANKASVCHICFQTLGLRKAFHRDVVWEVLSASVGFSGRLRHVRLTRVNDRNRVYAKPSDMLA